MVKKMQTIITFWIILMLVLSCVQINNAIGVSIPSTASLNYTNIAVVVDSEKHNLRGYSYIEQQDFWSSNQSTCLSMSMLKRTYTSFRNHERHEWVLTISDVISKVVLFSFIMFLCATGGAGLSMPFRCLLSYIHGMDGKKKIA